MRSSSPTTAPRPTWTSATTSASSTSTSTARPTSRPARSTRRSSPRSGAASTSGTPCRSSRTSPTRSSTASGAMASRRRRRGHHRGRRHGRRHRVAAVPGDRPPGPPRGRPGQRLRRAHLAAALHRPLRRAEDQAHPALGGGAAQHRYPAGRHRAARRPRSTDGHQAQDLADVRRGRGRRGGLRRRQVDLRHPQGPAHRGPGRLRRAQARPAVPRRRLDHLGRSAATGSTTPTTRSPWRWSASTSTCPTPTSRSPRRCAPAVSPTRPGSSQVGHLRRLQDAGRRRGAAR